jgi:hypothetical protein
MDPNLRLAITAFFRRLAEVADEEGSDPPPVPCPARPPACHRSNNVLEDTPPGLRLLGGDSFLKDRRYYVSIDGTVFLRESAYGGYSAPRWVTVARADLDDILLSGRTLAELAAAAACDVGLTLEECL